MAALTGRSGGAGEAPALALFWRPSPRAGGGGFGDFPPLVENDSQNVIAIARFFAIL
jgi:hypothetical protein